jgi:hypothetical protein
MKMASEPAHQLLSDAGGEAVLLNSVKAPQQIARQGKPSDNFPRLRSVADNVAVVVVLSLISILLIPG